MLVIENQGTGQLFYATSESAGFDICSNEYVALMPHKWYAVGTGLRIIESKFDDGFVIPELQLRPRSGLALKHGVTILNSPGTIDADYRGEIKVILINHSDEYFQISPGDRIAQAVYNQVMHLPGILVKNVTRGEGGFGSTGQ